MDDEVDEQSRGLKTFELQNNAGKIKERRRPKVIRYCRFNIEENPQEYFREMIMLFLPWRNELEDIEQANHEEIYRHNLDEIQKNFKLFNKIDLDLSAIYREVQEERDAEEYEIENEPSNRQQQEIEEEENQVHAVNYFDYDDTIIKPNIMIEMGEEAAGVDEVKRYKVPDQLNKQDYLNLCDSLNEKQHAYLMHLINCFKQKDIPIHHYISGSAGVGKSRLIEAINQSIIRLYRTEAGSADNFEVLLVAFTGNAAHNIKGMTAHSAFHLSTTEGTTRFKNLSDDLRNTLSCRFRNLKLLIIDEISMLSSDHFMEIDGRLRETLDPNKPFGGVSVITVGDFHQLRPVGAHYVFQDPCGKGLKQIAGNQIWKLFTMFELTEIMRQKEDKQFAEVLARVGDFKQTSEDIKLLESRIFKEETMPEEGKNAIRLVCAQKDVAIVNSNFIKRAENSGNQKIIKFTAIDKFIGINLSESSKTQAQYALDQFAANFEHKKTKNLPKELNLIIDMRYMVSTNLDVSDGLYNGAVGRLKFMEILNNHLEVIYLEFDDASVGIIARGNRKAVMTQNKLPSTWTPISTTKQVFRVTKSQTQVCREQFPLLEAEASTYHKSQGRSLNYVVNQFHSITKMRVNLQMMYVGLSRATTLNGLFIIGDLRIPAPTQDALIAIGELDRLRKDCTLKLNFTHLQTQKHPEYIQLTSFNIQSLPAHLSTIKADGVFKSSDILLLQEVWAVTDINYTLPGFIEIIRNNFDRPSARGTLVYSKNEQFQQVNGIIKSEFSINNRNIEISSFVINQIRIINVYCHPNSSDNIKNAFLPYKEYLREPNVLVCGDFNQNMSEQNGIEIYLKQEYGLTMLSPREPTTNAGTTIDAIFGRLRDFNSRCYIYESYISHHKPLVIQVFRK